MRRQAAQRPQLPVVVLQRRTDRHPARTCLHDQNHSRQDLQLPWTTDRLEVLRLPLHSVIIYSFLLFVVRRTFECFRTVSSDIRTPVVFNKINMTSIPCTPKTELNDKRHVTTFNLNRPRTKMCINLCKPNNLLWPLQSLGGAENASSGKYKYEKMQVQICKGGKCGAFKYLCWNYNKAVSACQTTLRLPNKICSCFESNCKISRLKVLWKLFTLLFVVSASSLTYLFLYHFSLLKINLSSSFRTYNFCPCRYVLAFFVPPRP